MQNIEANTSPRQSLPRIRVAAAILFNEQNEVLIDQRIDGRYPGQWEFPGGKIETGETARQALVRELQEEVGVVADEGAFKPLIQLHYVYEAYELSLEFFTASIFTGTPYGKEGQPVRWVGRNELPTIDFLPTNTPVLRALQLPDTCLITPEPPQQVAFLETLEQVLQQGVRMLQFRAKSLNQQDYTELAEKVIDLAQGYQAKVLLNSPFILPDNAHGLHLTAQQLMALEQRPALATHQMLSASCHTTQELLQASKVGVDFAFLSPVKATRSHPQVTPIGWYQFLENIGRINIPVYALGGMTEADIPVALEHGAQGVAAISALWNRNK